MADDEFTKGMEVEVCSNDPGLRGAWFVATCLRATNKKKKIFIQYKTLLADEKGSKPLREFIDAVNVRPIPPREIGRGFELSEEVDAYHNDGWWEGVVTKVEDGGKYVVYFRPAKEELEFGKEDLRLHREWVNGDWIPPMEDQQQEKQEKKEDQHQQQGGKTEQQKPLKQEDEQPQTTKSQKQLEQEEDQQQQEPKEKQQEKQEKEEDLQEKKAAKTGQQKQEKNTTCRSEFGNNGNLSKLPVEFKEGMFVEVSSDEEGFVGAWFEAKVIEAIGDKFLVEYQTLTNDDSALLREEVDTLHIRPPPPVFSEVDCFKLLEEVDAMHNEAWWVGVVANVISGPRYIVYFKETKEELEFGHSNLRLHQDWMDGRWVRPSQALKL